MNIASRRRFLKRALTWGAAAGLGGLGLVEPQGLAAAPALHYKFNLNGSITEDSYLRWIPSCLNSPSSIRHCVRYLLAELPPRGCED
ncbi:twin-arginine translocation signal domain-containing protein [Microbacterium sp. NPDC076911]|uniref:twin-arginine translocation signal domain-containing protein n=1 Tax=Microbacterium sp. NPDC076911 TaxID=3154958 RepID=UPI00343FE488